MFSEVNQKLQKPGECLPSIHKALGSISSIAKINKQTNKFLKRVKV
jgi:hypothetical protein